MMPTLELEHATVRFRYINHRMDEHTYLVDVEDIQFGPYGKGGIHHTKRAVWVLIGKVVERDGIHRGYIRRTFLMSETVDVEVVTT